jgi:hypothetical protein
MLNVLLKITRVCLESYSVYWSLTHLGKFVFGVLHGCA